MFQLGHIFDIDVESQASLLDEGMSSVAEGLLGRQRGNETTRPLIQESCSDVVKVAVSLFDFKWPFSVLGLEGVDGERGDG